jgi:hypothetical protein
MPTITALLSAFVVDQRTLTLLTLIAVDLVVGIMAALRHGKFDFRKVGQFYRSMVVPYLLGYCLIYCISLSGVAILLGSLWGELAATVGAGPAVFNLGARILDNLGDIRQGPAEAAAARAPAEPSLAATIARDNGIDPPAAEGEPHA